MSEAQDLAELIARSDLSIDDQEALFDTVLRNRPGIGGVLGPSSTLITLDSHPVPGGGITSPPPVAEEVPAGIRTPNGTWRELSNARKLLGAGKDTEVYVEIYGKHGPYFFVAAMRLDDEGDIILTATDGDHFRF